MNNITAYLFYGLMTALAPTAAVIASWKLTKGKLQDIHILVNSRLSEALTEIDTLKAELESVLRADPPEEKLEAKSQEPEAVYRPRLHPRL